MNNSVAVALFKHAKALLEKYYGHAKVYMLEEMEWNKTVRNMDHITYVGSFQLFLYMAIYD